MRPRPREISSPLNPILKVYRHALKEGRTREGWLAVEGPLLISAALNAADPAAEPGTLACISAVRSIMATLTAAEKFAGVFKRVPQEAERIEVSDRLFSSISQTVSPQGIAALVEVHPPPLEAVLSLHDVVLLVACGLQDPGNLGTMLRTAEALGAAAVICLKSTVNPSNPKVLRACGGAVFRLPVFAGLHSAQLFEAIRRANVRIIAADRESPSRVDEADLRGAVAFLIGSEAAGLAAEVEGTAELRLSIPAGANINSINAAMAAGIFLYEAARQRGFRDQLGGNVAG